MSEWIKCTDSLPSDPWEVVLVFSEEQYIYTARLQYDSWHCYCECGEGSGPYQVTHWMPLPNPPKETE